MDTIVTFGIPPTEPSTLYGYVQRKGRATDHDGLKLYDVEAFREKPDRATARHYLESSDYYWNSGLFVWTVRHIIECFKAFMPDHHGFIEAAVASGFASCAQPFAALPKISVDYGIMEKADRVKVIEAPFAWDDVGSWTALARHRPRDDAGNSVVGDSLAIDTENCIIYSEGARLVATVGLKDLVVVAVDDAVLVCHKNETARIKEIVEQLRALGKDKLL